MKCLHDVFACAVRVLSRRIQSTSYMSQHGTLPNGPGPRCLIGGLCLRSGSTGVPAADGAAAGHPALPRLVVGALGTRLLGELPPLRPLEAQGETGTYNGAVWTQV